MSHLTPAHWTAIQRRLREQVGDMAFDSWLAPLQLDTENTTAASISIAVPTRFMRDWVLRHYRDILSETIAEVSGLTAPVDFAVVPIAQAMAAPAATQAPKAAPAAPATPAAAPAASAAPASEKKPAAAPTTTPRGKVDQATAAHKLLEVGNLLDPRFTFDSFVTGKSNEFAYAAAKRIAEADEILYNPFLLYGGVGLGKTHLMHAIAWHIRNEFPQRRVLYISSEKFVFQFIRSLRDKKTMDFKQAFRSVDVLMIDDIQFIAGKEATQEEFFHTFNALIDMQKQVILTADRSPHEMDNVEDRLRSRLGWGLTTEIHKPNLETRIAILYSKASDMGIDLPKDVAMVLADRVASNVRELEGALNRLIAHADLVNRPINMETTQDLLKDVFQANNRLLTLDEIQLKVAEFYRIKLHDMHSARRSREVARPRQIAMFLSKQLTSKSFPEIGRAFGGRDHTTVMHAVKTVEKLRGDDASVAEDIRLLENMLTTA